MERVFIHSVLALINIFQVSRMGLYSGYNLRNFYPCGHYLYIFRSHVCPLFQNFGVATPFPMSAISVPTHAQRVQQCSFDSLPPIFNDDPVRSHPQAQNCFCWPNWRGGDTLDLYSEGAEFESPSGNHLVWGFSFFFSVPTDKIWDSTSITPRSLPSTSFSIHHSSIIAPSDVTEPRY
jgi:hypothetical protein